MQSKVHYKQTITASWSKTSTTYQKISIYYHVEHLHFRLQVYRKHFPIVRWRFQKRPLSVFNRGVRFKECKVTVKWLKTAGTNTRCPLRDGWLYQASARKTRVRGRGLSFFKECCFRVRVRVRVRLGLFSVRVRASVSPDPNPKTALQEKKKGTLRPRPRPRPRFLLTPVQSSSFPVSEYYC